MEILQTEHWKVFESKHRKDTVALVKSLLNKNITISEFLDKWGKLGGKFRGNSKGRQLYDFLRRFNWIK